MQEGCVMLSRVLEPEVMDTVAEAADYDAMDHGNVNRVFVNDLLTALGSDEGSLPAGGWRVFDAGTGTAQIPIALLQSGCQATVVAADAAHEMLRVAERNVAAAGLQDAITLLDSDCKRLPANVGVFDVVMSNSLIHHIPEPLTALRECWRIVRPGGLLFFRDLARPDTLGQVERLVQTYAGDANAAQQQLFRQSLMAALTMTEVAGLLAEIGIPPLCVALTSDRHWTISAFRPLTDAAG